MQPAHTRLNMLNVKYMSTRFMLKGTLMQIQKSPCMFVFIQK